jgi:DNA-binding MarR family transcriptional regulator
VLKTLEYEGELTQAQLIERTRLSSRTVRYALGQLEETGLITSQVSFMDARQRIYSLVPGSN